MSKITERELLCFTNLMNLRWEFVDLGKTKTKDPDTNKEKITSYYTIKELLDKEYLSIMSDGTSDRKPRAFFNLDNEDNPKIPSIPLYKDLAEFKLTSGMLYEYYEKYRDYGNKEGEFVNQWKVVFAADSYGLITYYLDNYFNPNNYVVRCQLDTGEICLMYKDRNVVKKYYNGVSIPAIGDELKKYADGILEIEKKIKNSKKYPTRKEMVANKKGNKDNAAKASSAVMKQLIK